MKSKLFCNEAGRIRPADVQPCERDVTTSFVLPSVPIHSAEVFVVARKTMSEASALAIAINGATITIDASPSNHARWLRASIDPALLCAGDNLFTVPAQSGWSLACEPSSGAPVLRLRVESENLDPDILLPHYGDAAIEANAQEWLALLPESLQVLDDRWQWCWKLAGFLASAWPYANEDEATSYAPWDARIILRWGRAGRDEHGAKPIVMCVHYAVCFVQFCIAMKVPARAVVLTPDLDSANGHFVAEVWLEDFQAWAMIDPNLHLCYRDGSTQRPLAIAELYARRKVLPQLAEFGDGFDFQKAKLENFAQEYCLSGEVYRLWGVWGRHDWIKNPDLAPPANGAVVYVETDIIWCGDNDANRRELGMFPHFLQSQQLALSPCEITA